MPDYLNERDRAVNLVIWYSHIIAHALKGNYIYLAQEEAKTLLDDLHPGSNTSGLKTQEQINLVLQSVSLINEEAEKNNLHRARLSAQLLITEINTMFNIAPAEIIRSIYHVVIIKFVIVCFGKKYQILTLLLKPQSFLV